jgi:hypothetical protein
MKYQENAVLDTLLRAQHFFDDNGAVLTGVVNLTAARKRLDDVAADFTTHALDQDVGNRGAKGESAKQRHGRESRARRVESRRPLSTLCDLGPYLRSLK